MMLLYAKKILHNLPLVNWHYWVQILSYHKNFRVTYSKCRKSSFSLITSADIGISSQKFLTFNFNLSATLVLNFKAIQVPVLNYWIWTKNTPQKNCFFWSNPFKIEVMITSLIEMPYLPNFDQMTTSTI